MKVWKKECRKRITGMVFCLLIGMLTGCGTVQKKNEEGSAVTTTIQKEDENLSAADRLYALLQEDKARDQKTVEWDGEIARMVEDEYDSDVDDGRSGPSCNNRYTADQLIEFDYPFEFEQIDPDEEQPDHCHFVNGDCEIMIQPISYADEVDQFEKDENYHIYDGLWLRDDRVKLFKNCKTYVGIKEIDGVKKAGYVVLLESKHVDRSYKIEVYGLGDMYDIRINAFVIMNQFDVVWY